MNRKDALRKVKRLMVRSIRVGPQHPEWRRLMQPMLALMRAHGISLAEAMQCGAVGGKDSDLRGLGGRATAKLRQRDPANRLLALGTAGCASGRN